jgi:hypothetical protein
MRFGAQVAGARSGGAGRQARCECALGGQLCVAPDFVDGRSIHEVPHLRSRLPSYLLCTRLGDEQSTLVDRNRRAWTARSCPPSTTTRDPGRQRGQGRAPADVGPEFGWWLESQGEVALAGGAHCDGVGPADDDRCCNGGFRTLDEVVDRRDVLSVRHRCDRQVLPRRFSPHESHCGGGGSVGSTTGRGCSRAASRAAGYAACGDVTRRDGSAESTERHTAGLPGGGAVPLPRDRALPTET